MPNAAFSFPGLGIEGPPNVAVALFSFLVQRHMNGTASPFLKMNSVRPSRPDLMRQNFLTQYEVTFLVPMFE